MTKKPPWEVKWWKFQCSHSPSGSTSRATLSASEVAMSVFAAVTARMMEFGFEMNLKINSLIWISMSLGWSPTGNCWRDTHTHTDLSVTSRRIRMMNEEKGRGAEVAVYIYVLAAHLCNTRKVHQREVHNIWREDFKMNGFIADALQRKKTLGYAQKHIPPELQLLLGISPSACN